MKSRLVESQEATVTNQNQAFLTAKKLVVDQCSILHLYSNTFCRYKQKCRQLEQDNLKLNQDREQLVVSNY